MSNTSFVRVSDLYKIYQMGNQEVRALDGVSLELQEGSFNVIMGPSGSGKSTLLYLVGGLDWPTSGQIEVDGQRIELMDENQLAQYRREKLGFIFQSFNLVSSMSAEANVAFPLRFSGVKKAKRLKRAVSLLERMGLKERIGHKPTELSGGQQQRVAVSRALVNNPSLILADEPTGNLDTTSGTIIMDLLKELREEGKTILVATHDPRMLQYATKAIFLIDGKEVSEENYKKIIQQQG
ncbi:MAG: ABC transporter ATP-binding protein [Chloroflexi bacterium]|jgi:putative ABC transport system ATP-binding protein|nr:ABC transporter ATP-binding protein [Chloroflexota bacterium]